MKKSHKQIVASALISDKLVTKKKFPNIQLHTRITELRKDGLCIDCHMVQTYKGRTYMYELNYKKSKKIALRKYEKSI